VAGSSSGKDLRVFEQNSSKVYHEICSVTHLTGGVLTLDVDKSGYYLAYGTTDGEFTILQS
jgi:hypothetical protein